MMHGCASTCSLFTGCRNRVASILIIAAGTMYYTWAKSVESAPPPQRAAPAPQDDIEAGAATGLLHDTDDEVYDMQEKKASPP